MYSRRYIERMGTGIDDMLRISKETGLRQPEFEITDGFTARIWRKGVPKTGKKGSGKGSGKTRDLIVELMRENPGITIPEIAEILGKNTDWTLILKREHTSAQSSIGAQKAKKLQWKSDANPKQIRSKSDTKMKEKRRKCKAKAKQKQRKDDRLEWILRELETKGRIMAEDVEDYFSIHRVTAVRDLNALLQQGTIVKKGGGNNVWYELEEG